MGLPESVEILPEDSGNDLKKLAKVRYTITVSSATEDRVQSLKEYTDADTTSEVFREAINITALLVKLEKQGIHLEIVNPKEPEKRERLAIGRRIAA